MQKGDQRLAYIRGASFEASTLKATTKTENYVLNWHQKKSIVNTRQYGLLSVPNYINRILLASNMYARRAIVNIGIDSGIANARFQ